MTNILQNKGTGKELSALKTCSRISLPLWKPQGLSKHPRFLYFLQFPNPSLGPGMAHVPRTHLWVPQEPTEYS